MSTDKAPDFAGIAEQLAYKAISILTFERHFEVGDFVCRNHEDAKEHADVLRDVYASCMEARLRSDWETIRLLRASDHIASCAMYDPVPLVPKDCDCGLSAHLSKLLEPFTP